jgi:hypothetical protein
LGLTDLALSSLAVYCFVTGQWLYALFFLALDFIHSLVTTILLLIGSFEDGQGHIVCYPGQELNKH